MGKQEVKELFINKAGEKFNINSMDVLNNLLAMSLISVKSITRFLIINDYESLIVENQGRVNSTMLDLSIKYDKCESQIKNIVYPYLNRLKS